MILLVNLFFPLDTHDISEMLLIIGIMSAQNNIEYRNSIRETWLKLVYNDPRFKYFFIIGKHSCPIPLADRLDNFTCNTWNASFPKGNKQWECLVITTCVPKICCK